MAQIPPDEIQYSSLSTCDDVGRVFHWRGGIYRGIKAQGTKQVHALFESGCLNELIERGLFPRYQITDHALEGFAFVVKHEAIPILTYPHEWSFDMFRDAALAALEVGSIAARYGWSLKDCHPYNVLFYGARPMFVDLGSFTQTHGRGGLIVDTAFLNLYWYPLAIWAAGDSFLARRVISCANEMMSDVSWALYQHPTLRGRSRQRINRVMRRRTSLLSRGANILDYRPSLRRAATSMVNHLPAELLVYRPELMRQKIMNLKPPTPASEWHDYQGEYFDGDERKTTARFNRIVEIIQSLDCDSVVELAGNRGLLSLLLYEKTSVQSILSTDNDSNATNLFHLDCRSLGAPSDKIMQSAVLNFMVPELNFYTVPPPDRFRADIVTALAITHHLILTQNFDVKEILRTIAGYTRRFALVEFMPLGLWNGETAPPLPEWYTLEWFQQAFKEWFELVSVEQVEANRVLHLGRLRTNSDVV